MRPSGRASVQATVWIGWRRYFLSIYSPQLVLNVRPTARLLNSIVRLCCCCCRCCYCWKSYCGQLTAVTHTHTNSHRWHSAVLFCRVFSTWRKRMEPWFSQLERAHFVCRSENFPYMFEFRSKSALKYFCYSLIKLVYKMYSTKRTHFSNYPIPFYRPSVDCESAKIRNFSFHCRRWWPILV